MVTMQLQELHGAPVFKCCVPAQVSGKSLVQYGFGLSAEATYTPATNFFATGAMFQDGDDRILYTYHLKKAPL